MHLIKINRFEIFPDGEFTFYNKDRNWAIHYKIKKQSNGFNQGAWVMLKKSEKEYIEVGREATNMPFIAGDINLDEWKKLHNELWVKSMVQKQYPTPLFEERKRYGVKFNFQALQVDFNLLDTKHQLLKMVYSNHYGYIWKYFVNHYELSFKSLLEKCLWARQMLLTFVTKFNKFNNLWKNPKFKWIVEQTPHYYIQRLKWLRGFNKKEYIARYFIKLIDSRTAQHTWVKLHTRFCTGPDKNQKICPLATMAIKGTNNNNWVLKCWETKCPKRKRIQLRHTELYGRKVDTKQMVKLFNGEQCVVGLTISNKLIQELGCFTNNNSKITFISYRPRTILNQFNHIHFEAKRMSKIIRGFNNIVDELTYIIPPFGKEQAIRRYIRLFSQLREVCDRFKNHRSYNQWILTLEKYRFQLS